MTVVEFKHRSIELGEKVDLVEVGKHEDTPEAVGELVAGRHLPVRRACHTLRLRPWPVSTRVADIALEPQAELNARSTLSPRAFTLSSS